MATSLGDSPSSTDPQGAERETLISRLTSSRTLIGRIADLLLLLGIVLAPNFGLAIGGRLGFAFADLVLGLAAVARGFHLLIEGIPLAGIRRHSYLIGLLTVFSLASTVSHLANGQSIPLILITVVIATLGSVLLVATFGTPEQRYRDLKRLLTAFGIGSTLLGASCFLGPKSADGRAIGWAIHPNALGHSCVMGVAVCVWLWDHAESRAARWVWAIAAAINVGAVMESGSRGGVLGLGVGAVAYLALRGSFRLKLVAIGATWLAVVVLLTGVVHLPPGNPIQRLVSGGASTAGSDEARLQLLEGDLASIAQDPVLGKGFDAILNVHMVYFQGWIGGGAIAGVVVMLLGATMLLLPLWHRPRDLALACGATAIAIAWFFTNILTARDQWIFLALTFATARSIFVLARGASDPPQPS